MTYFSAREQNTLLGFYSGPFVQMSTCWLFACVDATGYVMICGRVVRMRKIAGCACAGNSGITNCFLWSLWRGKYSRHSQRMHNPQFYVSGEKPMAESPHRWTIMSFYVYLLLARTFCWTESRVAGDFRRHDSSSFDATVMSYHNHY